MYVNDEWNDEYGEMMMVTKKEWEMEEEKIGQEAHWKNGEEAKNIVCDRLSVKRKAFINLHFG
jgi:hypothetical protein